MSTGERIKQLRKEEGLTQKELADQLSLSLDMIKSLEQNRTSLSVENLKRFAEFFDCSTDYLLGKTDDRQSTLMTTEEQYELNTGLDKIIEILSKGKGVSDENVPELRETINRTRELAKVIKERIDKFTENRSQPRE